MNKTVELKNSVPSGWLAFTPMVKHSFEFGTVKVFPFEDRSSGFIECSEESETQFGTLMQTLDATEFVGKIVCLEGMTKTNSADTRSKIFLEVNDEQSRMIQASSFVSSTPPDWQHFSLKVFVPNSSATICFGGLLNGPGKLLFNSLELTTESQSGSEHSDIEIADDHVARTVPEEILQTPRNLDFMDATDSLPEFWHTHCRNTDEFRTAIHFDDAANGRYLSIACPNPKRTYAAGAVLQTFDAAFLRGDMIELSALLKSEDVVKQSGLFIRVNGPSRLLERMDNGLIIGSIDWKLYKVRLSVPQDAISVSIGFYLEGGGRLCIKQVAFSKIESEVFTLPTSISLSRRPLKPVNLELN